MRIQTNRLTLLIGVFYFLSVSPATAFEGTLVAEHLVAEGINFYAQGEYPQAIHEFSKALLVDPNNEEAQYYLGKMGMGTGLLFGEKRTKDFHLGRAIKNVDWYQQQLTQIEKDRADKEKVLQWLYAEKKKLDSVVANKLAENQQLRGKISQVQQHFKSKTAQDRALLSTMEKQVVEKDKTISCLNDELCALEKTLVTKVSLLEEKQKQVAALDKQIVSVRESARRKAAEDRALINGIEQISAQKSHQIARLNTDLYQLKNQLKSEIQDSQEKEQKVKDLSGDLRALERELTITESRWESTRVDYDRSIQNLEIQLEQQLRHKAAAEDKYSKDFKKLKQLLQVKQTEIVIKNGELAKADIKLDQAHRELDASKRLIAQLQQSLGMLDEELAKTLNKDNEALSDNKQTGKNVRDHAQRVAQTRYLEQEDRIMAELKAKLATARTQIADIERGGKKIDLPKLLELKEKLTEVKIWLKQRQEKGGGQKGDFTVLSQRLRDTQEQLALVVQDIEARNIQVKEMEKQLNSVLTQAEK